MIELVENLIFPGGLAGDKFIFAGIIVLIIVMLLFMANLPIEFILILVLPGVLIGGGSLIAGSIPSWVKLMVVIAIMVFLALAYVGITSSNK
jgi:hypothetical protein